MKESTIEGKARKYALEQGIACYKFKSDNNRAVPDRLFINTWGVTFYIEFKAPGKKPTEAQKRKAIEMGWPKTPIFWADDLEVAMDIIYACATWKMPHTSKALMGDVPVKYTCFDL